VLAPPGNSRARPKDQSQRRACGVTKSWIVPGRRKHRPSDAHSQKMRASSHTARMDHMVRMARSRMAHNHPGTRLAENKDADAG
jgi:hypothetical protein